SSKRRRGSAQAPACSKNPSDWNSSRRSSSRPAVIGPEELQRVRALRAVIVACLLNAVGSPMDLLIGSRIQGMPSWPAISSGAVGAVLAGALVVRRHASIRTSSVALLVNTMAIATFLWITNTYYASGATPWIPYQATKLGVLVTALLAPELWSGIVTI